MTGSVLTASLDDIERIAAEKLQAQAPPGTEFVEGSISVEPGVPSIGDDGAPDVYGDRHRPSVGQQSSTADALKEQLRGKTKSDAQAILDLLGTATITLSPDFMWSLPDDPNRIVLNDHATRERRSMTHHNRPDPSHHAFHGRVAACIAARSDRGDASPGHRPRRASDRRGARRPRDGSRPTARDAGAPRRRERRGEPRQIGPRARCAGAGRRTAPVARRHARVRRPSAPANGRPPWRL